MRDRPEAGVVPVPSVRLTVVLTGRNGAVTTDAANNTITGTSNTITVSP